MGYKPSHHQRNLYAECGHVCDNPDYTLCDEPDCERAAITVLLIDNWCTQCYQSRSLWRLLGPSDNVDAVWKYWNGLHACCDETTGSQLKRLWGPSKLDSVTTVKSRLIASRTVNAEDFWMKRLCWAANFTLQQDANSVICFKQGTKVFQHKRGNTADLNLKTVIQACIDACKVSTKRGRCDCCILMIIIGYKRSSEQQYQNMSSPAGFYKYRCKYFYLHNCTNWVWVREAPCPTCLVSHTRLHH